MPNTSCKTFQQWQLVTGRFFFGFRQEMEADRIYGTAENARNTSRTAYELAREALRKPGDTADEIDELRRE